MWRGSPSARASGTPIARAASLASVARTVCTSEKRLEPEPARAARQAAGRQDVRRAGRVVADHGRRADEDAAGVADERRDLLGPGSM